MGRGRGLVAFGLIALLNPLTARAESVPQEYREAAEAAGEAYGICPELLEAISYEESRFTNDAESPDGKYVGSMQISPSIHGERMERLGISDLKDPKGAMLVAADYLAELFEENEDVGAVLMHYGGSGKRIPQYEREHGK